MPKMPKTEMLPQHLKGKRIILASGSPRRQRFFEEMGFEFEIRLKTVDEIHPSGLKGSEISDYLAKLKATPFDGTIKANEVLITSDTVVWHKNKSLAKPADEEEAVTMLKMLSNDWHEVITSVCLSTMADQRIFNATTRVKFAALSDLQIRHYIETCSPFDKAGGYGIQEWIGLIGIEEIQGSYTNVVGLPTHLVYQELMKMVK